MARARYFVAPHGVQWKIIHEDKEYYYSTQAEAIQAARTAAHKSFTDGHTAQIMVARPNGQWRTEWTYGNDPPEYPG